MAIIKNHLLDTLSFFFDELHTLLGVASNKQLIETGFFVYLVGFFCKLNLLLELNKFPCSLLNRLQVSFTSHNSLVEKAHLKLAESFIEIESSVSTDELSHMFLQPLLFFRLRGLGFVCYVRYRLLLTKQNRELAMRHLEFTCFEEACSLVEPSFVVQSLVFLFNYLLKLDAGLVVLSKLEQMAANEEGVWEPLDDGS